MTLPLLLCPSLSWNLRPTTKRVLKYLRVQLDTKLMFWEHIRGTSEKVAKVTVALSKLMANVGGLSTSKWQLLMSVTHFLLLYGHEIWPDAPNQVKYRKKWQLFNKENLSRWPRCTEWCQNLQCWWLPQ